MDVYFYKIEKVHHRTLERIAVVAGVVFAENEQEAEDKAWKRSGGDTARKLFLARIPEEGFDYYIPIPKRRADG